MDFGAGHRLIDQLPFVREKWCRIVILTLIVELI